MKIFLTHSPQLGRAKAFLLEQVFQAAAKNAEMNLVNSAQDADVAIIFGEQMPNNAALNGKKSFFN